MARAWHLHGMTNFGNMVHAWNEQITVGEWFQSWDVFGEGWVQSNIVLV